MTRIPTRSVASVLAACAALAACSGSGEARSTHDAGPDNEVTSCPPAPLEGEFEGRPCHDPQLGCPYASPNGFQYKWPNICDVEAMGQCWQGAFAVLATTVNCCPVVPSDVSWCSPSLTEGAPCNEPDNSECVLPDQSATCACDKPGPIWRCAAIDGGVQYCDCAATTLPCHDDAGADAGNDAGADAGNDAGPDTGNDAGVGAEAGNDAAAEAGVDGGP